MKFKESILLHMNEDDRRRIEKVAREKYDGNMSLAIRMILREYFKKNEINA